MSFRVHPCPNSESAIIPSVTHELQTPEAITLRDGTAAHLRLLRPDDTERIKAFFYRLSPESIFYRALEVRTTLSDDEARRLCDVDGLTRVALAAVIEKDGAEQIIGVARYGLPKPKQTDTAESAVVVEDAYQGKGLGRALTTRLVEYARNHGIRRFVATIHLNNNKILQFIKHSGLRVRRHIEGNVWDMNIYLDPPQ